MVARYSIAVIAALAVSGWVAPVHAANDRVVVVPPPGAYSAGDVATTPQVITGKIRKVDTVKDAAGVKHKVVEIQAGDARYLVHLGPKESLGKLDVDKGDTITVDVVPGQFNGQSMFDAYRLRDDDGRVVQLAPLTARTVVPDQPTVIRIERPRTSVAVPATPAPETAVPATPAPETAVPAAPAPSADTATTTRSLQGQVIDAWTADVPNYGEVQMARVRMADGTIVPVDLGLRRGLPEGFSLAPGSWVEVTGRWSQSGNQQVLVADTLTRSQRVVR